MKSWRSSLPFACVLLKWFWMPRIRATSSPVFFQSWPFNSGAGIFERKANLVFFFFSFDLYGLLSRQQLALIRLFTPVSYPPLGKWLDCQSLCISSFYCFHFFPVSPNRSWLLNSGSSPRRNAVPLSLPLKHFSSPPLKRLAMPV